VVLNDFKIVALCGSITKNSMNDQSANVVIVAYKPKPGKSKALKELVLNHVPELAKLGLVTNRKPVIVEAADGTIIEVFEWLSADVIQQAHTNPYVHKI
jgi:hypothetical protein